MNNLADKFEKESTRDIKALKYLIKRLSTFNRNLKKDIEKEKERNKISVSYLYEMYETEDDVSEAYGYGDIARKEMEMILDGMEAAENRMEDSVEHKVKAVSILSDFIRELNEDCRHTEQMLNQVKERVKNER